MTTRPMFGTVWRFMRHVHLPPTDDCWIWLGYVDSDGYGQFHVGTPNKGMEYAHRYAYATFVGRLRRGLTIDHLCFNRRCVRPDHLEQVTNRTNIRRAHARRRAMEAAAAVAVPNMNAALRNIKAAPTNQRTRAASVGHTFDAMEVAQ